MKRAFVMPVVVLLALVASLTVAVVLNRNAVRASDADAQVQSYIDDHRERGLREVIALWLQFSARQEFEELLTDEGQAFSVDFSGDRTLTVWLTQSQSTALVNPAGLETRQPTTDVMALERQREIANLVRLNLESANPRYPDLLGRQAGPLAVNILLAPPEVIRAMAMAVIGNAEIADAYTNDLVRLRDGQSEITRLQLLDVARDAGVGDDEQSEITALWTTEPTLWSLRAELTGPSGVLRDATIGRYQALVVIPREDETDPLLTGSEHANSWFLDWKRLDEGVGYTPTGSVGPEQGGGL